MIPVLRKTKSVARLAAHAYRHRGVYASSWDSLKAFALRLASVDSGRQRLRPGRSTLRLRVPPARLAFRRASCDFLLVRDIFEDGEYAMVSKWGLPPDAVIFDLGANIGFATVYFASLCPTGRFVLVEPDSGNIALLEENVASLLRTGQATVNRGFVAAQDGFAGINREGDYWGFRKVEVDGDATERIRCFSMPTLIREAAVQRIDLLKCDIEGSEIELFRNCGAWIDSVHHLIVEVHEPYSRRDLYDDLRRAGWPFDVVEERPAGPHWVCFLRRSLDRR